MCHKELGWGESWHRVRSAAVSPVPAEPPSQCHRPPPPQPWVLGTGPLRCCQTGWGWGGSLCVPHSGQALPGLPFSRD